MSLQKVLLVDLDGTLLNTNTFHKYILFITRYYFGNKSYKTLVILIITLFRFARLISHAKLKYEILKISKDLPKEVAESFGRSLLKYQNQSVSDIITKHKGLKILASAAPEIYTRPLGDRFNFHSTLSTKCPEDKEWCENIRENKKTSLINFLTTTENQYSMDLIVTDHHDDLPLMEIFNRIILVNPSDKTLLKTEHLGSKIRIIR